MVKNYHLEFVKAVVKTKDVSSYLKKTDPELYVINAESLFARFITEHNLPIAATDHANELFKKMFLDSKIEKNIVVDIQNIHL